MALDPLPVVGDTDYYAAAPQTLVASAASSDSLARVVGGDIFGVYWSSFGGNGKITAIDGVDMKGRADGVQDLATATYSTFKGVEAAVSSSNSSVVEQLIEIRNNLYDTNGTVYTRLVEFMTAFNKLSRNMSQPFAYMGGTFENLHAVAVYGESLADLFARYSYTVLQTSYLSPGSSYLDSSGHITTHSFARTNSFVLSSGLAGLSYLFFGDETHDINGLSALGRDYIGHRGSWSLSDITANGFSGLATLVAGSDAHREDGYVWLGQSGYLANGSASLMDVLGEGFLGLSSLFSVSEPGDPRLSWMYVSPDDGVSGQQLSYNTLFGFLGAFGSGVQNPLARLAYVLADLDDIVLKQQEKPNLDAVKDSFFGDGDGAVNPDQIKDAAGISSAAKDAFGGAGSPGDAFTAINDSQSFWFFSQEVADALDTVNAAAPASEDEDDFMNQFIQDEDGFYSLLDLSPWDVGSYLGG